jgi:hypothetical protein
MIDARDPAASYGVTVTGTAQVLTGESVQMQCGDSSQVSKRSCVSGSEGGSSVCWMG